MVAAWFLRWCSLLTKGFLIWFLVAAFCLDLVRLFLGESLQFGLLQVIQSCSWVFLAFGWFDFLAVLVSLGFIYIQVWR